MKQIYHYPKIIIAVITLITLFFAAQLPKVELDNDVFNMLPKQSRSSLAVKRTESIFGGSLIMAVGLEPDSGSILSKQGIDLIINLTEQFENLGLTEDILSLSNADYIDGDAEGMVVSPLIENFTGSFNEIETLKQKLLSWDAYQKGIISEDFTSSQIILTLDDGLDIDARERFFYQVKQIAEDTAGDQYIVHIAGVPALSVLISANMSADMEVMLPIVFLVVVIALYLSFRRVSGVLLPLMNVVVSTIWAIGLMGLLGIKLSIIGSIIPVLLIAVGSAYGIHIINNYYNEMHQFKGDMNPQAHLELILHTIQTVGRPVALAGLTTMAGFASLAFSDVIPMRDFGIFTSFGIFAALIIAITLIPALLLLRKTDKKHITAQETTEVQELTLLEKLLVQYHAGIGKHNVFIVFVFFVIVLFSALSARNLIVDNATIDTFKEDTHVVRADNFIREKFAGTNTLDIVFVGEHPGDGVNPELLKVMDDLKIKLLKDHANVANVSSYTDIIKRINQVMHVESSSDDLDHWDDSDFTNDDDSAQDISSFFSDDEEEPSSFFSDDATDGSKIDTTTQSNQVSSFFSDGDEATEANSSATQISAEPTYTTSSALGDLSADAMNNLMMQAYAMSNNVDLSAAELIEYMQRATNYKGKAYDEIPFEPAKYNVQSRTELQNLISQYLVLAGSDTGNLADDNLEPQRVRMTVMMNSVGNVKTIPVIETIVKYSEKNLPTGYEMFYSGGADIEASLVDNIVGTSQKSILLSLIIVFFIIWISFGSITAGLLGILPLAVTIIVSYGIMAHFGIKLDMNTALTGSIAIGVGVDYSIHFLSSYRYHGLKGDDVPNGNEVTHHALLSSGKAIIFNAFSVAAGFAVLMFSQFNPLVNLGLLISLTMLISSITAMTLLPALLNLIKPKFIFSRG